MWVRESVRVCESVSETFAARASQVDYERFDAPEILVARDQNYSRDGLKVIFLGKLTL